MRLKLENSDVEKCLNDFYEKTRCYKGFDKLLLEKIINYILSSFEKIEIKFEDNYIVFNTNGIQFCSIGVLETKCKINVYFTIKVSDMSKKNQEDDRFLKGRHGHDSGFGIKTLEEFEEIKGYIKIAYDELNQNQ